MVCPHCNGKPMIRVVTYVESMNHWRCLYCGEVKYDWVPDRVPNGKTKIIRKRTIHGVYKLVKIEDWENLKNYEIAQKYGISRSWVSKSNPFTIHKKRANRLKKSMPNRWSSGARTRIQVSSKKKVED